MRGCYTPSSSSSKKKKQNPPLSHSHYPPSRAHRREIIFHAKLTRPMQRDSPPPPRCPAILLMMTGQREGRQKREGVHPSFTGQSRMNESSEMNESPQAELGGRTPLAVCGGTKRPLPRVLGAQVPAGPRAVLSRRPRLPDISAVKPSTLCEAPT